MFGICFSLDEAVMWEFFEYMCTITMGFDIMEDSYVDKINSYLLSGTHSQIGAIHALHGDKIHSELHPSLWKNASRSRLLFMAMANRR